jgi:lysophospholipase L1-like esterase
MTDDRPGRGSRIRGLVCDLAIVTAATLALALLLEGGTRLVVRWRSGSWPTTRLARFDHDVRSALRLYRRHPFLNVAPNEGQRVEAFGRQASFNSLGYRSPERPAAKAAGVVRVVCSGGSTTFDILAADDLSTWPWRLELALAEVIPEVEVWNAGFPGWTSAENLIALELRDVNLRPDVVVLFQGINDLQPASHRPFDASYEQGHARQTVRAMGFELEPLPIYERSVFFETVRDAVIGPPDPFARLETVPAGDRRRTLPGQAVVAYERNLRSLVAVARTHGARVVLATQPLRVRAASGPADLAYLAEWIPGLEPETVPVELERLNQAMRLVASGTDAVLADVAREVPWSDGDFADPMHFSAAGSARMAGFLADLVASLVQDQPGGPAGRGR